MTDVLNSLRNGETVILRSPSDPTLLIKLIPENGGFKAMAKMKGKTEYEVKTDTALVVDAMYQNDRATERVYQS